MLYWRSSLFRRQGAFCFDWFSWDYLYLWQVCSCETEEKLLTKCIVRMEEYLYSVLFAMMGLRGQNPSHSSPTSSIYLIWMPFHWTDTRKHAFFWQHFLHHRHSSLLRARQMTVWTCAVRKMAFNQSQEDVSILGTFHELLFEVRVVNKYYWNVIQIPSVYTILYLTQPTLSIWLPRLPPIHV